MARAFYKRYASHQWNESEESTRMQSMESLIRKGQIETKYCFHFSHDNMYCELNNSFEVTTSKATRKSKNGEVQSEVG